jgi:hypothetical protein
MTGIPIPLPSIVNTRGSATFRTQLDGRDYVFVLQWNQRMSRWTMDIADQDSVPIASGIVLVVEFPLLSLVTDERKPPGSLAIVDLQSPKIDPTLESLGSRHQLVYWPEA